MAFTMTHLIVSKRVSEMLKNEIKSPPQFYLGTIAPDAVHNRANFTYDFKKVSHLVTQDEKWGELKNHDGWKNNIIDFLNKRKNSENRDFILGYCSHLLTDVYNSENVWTPFRLSHAAELEGGFNLHNLHHQENNKIDIELALTYEGRDEFWLHLANSSSIDLLNLVYATELDKQRDNILNSWYKDKECPDISANKVRTLEGEMDFIEKAADFVFDVFQKNLP